MNGDKNVSPETLAELSGKWGIGYDEMTILLLHPNFPQERRSDLIRPGGRLLSAAAFRRIRTGRFTASGFPAHGIAMN